MKTRRRLHPTGPARTGAAGGGIIVTLVLAVSALAAPPASAAQTLRVAQQDPGCSDTSGSPYCSIGAANRLAAAGDVVEVDAGTYREQVSAVSGVTYRAVSSNALIVGSDPATGPWTDAGGGSGRCRSPARRPCPGSTSAPRRSPTRPTPRRWAPTPGSSTRWPGPCRSTSAARLRRRCRPWR